jgi:hypothetical protein
VDRVSSFGFELEFAGIWDFPDSAFGGIGAVDRVGGDPNNGETSGGFEGGSMKKSWVGIGLIAAFAALIPLATLVGQEPPDRDDKDKPPPVGSGIKVIVTQTEGVKTEVSDLEMRQEKLGIISLTLVPVDSYMIRKGRAQVTVPIRRIERIIFNGEDVSIKGRKGSIVEGKVDTDSRFFLFGTVAMGEYKIDLAHVKSLEFIHPTGRLQQCPSCNRIYENKEWRYCPHDGARLKSED